MLEKAKEGDGKKVLDSNELSHQQSGDSHPKPVKKRLNYSTADANSPKQKTGNKSTLPKRKRSNQSCSSTLADDPNPSCLYCDALYLESVNEYRPWIQCQGICKKWCHRVCSGVDRKDNFCANFALANFKWPCLARYNTIS